MLSECHICFDGPPICSAYVCPNIHHRPHLRVFVFAQWTGTIQASFDETAWHLDNGLAPPASQDGTPGEALMNEGSNWRRIIQVSLTCPRWLSVWKVWCDCHRVSVSVNCISEINWCNSGCWKWEQVLWVLEPFIHALDFLSCNEKCSK